MDLILRGVSKSYGNKTALRQVDLSLSAAQSGITALLGPNGSGKSTLLRVLATLAHADGGWISFGSHLYNGNLAALRSALGYLPQNLDLPEFMTALKLLHYLADVRQIPKARIPQLISALNLQSFVDKPLGTLSSGQHHLVGIAQAMLGESPLLLLDELMRGLDAQERERVRRLLRTQGVQQLVIFSSHVPAEVEQIADTIIVINKGQIVYAGRVEALGHLAEGKVHEVEVEADAVPMITSQCTVSHIQHGKAHVILRIVGQVPGRLKKTPVFPTLEDAYLYLCTQWNSHAEGDGTPLEHPR